VSLAVVIALSGLVGVSLGLLGGGGTILMVPVLLYAAALPTKVAIAMSLLVVSATSAAGLVSHARAGYVRWGTGLLFAAAAMVGAFGGGWAARFVPSWLLLVGFGLMMLFTAVTMLRGGPEPEQHEGTRRVPALIALDGISVGAVTGLVGAGGGFLVVPALVVLGGLKMRDAIGTSLLVVSLKSMAGFAGYASHVSIDYGLASQVIAAAVVGALVGAAVGRRISPAMLRTGFAWFVLAMSLFVLGPAVVS
jgi:uncharacterized membrane protein YfcA